MHFFLYKEWSKGKHFSLMHIFTKLETCPKWEKTCYNLGNGKNVIDIDGEEPTPSSSDSVGRPIGNKKAKAQRNGAASMEPSLDMMIAEVVASTKVRDEERDDKSDARWKVLLDKDYQKGLA
jgi:hypothetical protein